MRNLQLTLAGAVILGLLAGLVGVVVAQDPAEPSVEGAGPVTGKLIGGERIQWPEVAMVEGDQERRGAMWADTLELDDPRLSGTIRYLMNRDVIGGQIKQGLGEVLTGTVEITNDMGSWIGTMRGYVREDPRRHYWDIELTGTDAHEGNSALLHVQGLSMTYEVEGFVFPGVLPEYPDPVEVPSE